MQGLVHYGQTKTEVNKLLPPRRRAMKQPTCTVEDHNPWLTLPWQRSMQCPGIDQHRSLWCALACPTHNLRSLVHMGVPLFVRKGGIEQATSRLPPPAAS